MNCGGARDGAGHKKLSDFAAISADRGPPSRPISRAAISAECRAEKPAAASVRIATGFSMTTRKVLVRTTIADAPTSYAVFYSSSQWASC